jgi:Domain of unknown function (DUF5666)
MKSSKSANQPLVECHTDNPQSIGVPDMVSRRAGLLTLLASAMALAGCGGGAGGAGAGADGGLVGAPGANPGGGLGPAGGTDVAGVTSGGTGSVSVGSVTGIGSIIVNGNGVRIDTSSATITDEDGNNLNGRIRLGMQVVSIGTRAASGAVAAQSIVASGELLGRIEDLPNSNFQFTVLGQKVQVVGSTVFDASLPNGFSSLVNDDVVEIHGLLDAKHNILTATFIERKPSAGYFKIIGFVNNNSNPSNSFKIANLVISTTGALPAKDSLVRVRLTSVAPGTPFPKVWTAIRISGTEILATDRDSFEIQGRISAYTSSSSFSVDGVPVVVLGAVVIANPNGVVLDLASATTAALVEVRGRLAGGILTASSVTVESENSLSALEFELHDKVSNLVVTATGGSFNLLVAGYKVVFTTPPTPNPTTFVNGLASALANDVKVQVKGAADPAVTSGTQILATNIRFE